MGKLIKYVTRRFSPTRIIFDDIIKKILSNLKGTIIEIGGSKSGKYKVMSGNSDYIISNITDDVFYLDVMDMNLKSESVDNFVCVNVLEHVPKPKKSVNEILRVLKPGGFVLFSIPFMYPFHGAPSDYQRFTFEGIKILLKDFEILEFYTVGNFCLCVSQFISRLLPKPFYKHMIRFIMFLPLGLLGYIFYVVGFNSKPNKRFAMLFIILCKKKGG